MMPVTPGLTIDADSAHNDAFGRQRTSDPRTLFSSTHVVTDGSDFWQTIFAGAGAATHLPNEAAVRLRCGTAATVVAAMTWRELY